MYDMNCQDAKDMYYRELSDKVDYYKNNERGENGMCEIMEELFAEDRKEIEKNAEQNANLKSIRNIMISFNLGAEKAMEGLKIPKEEQPVYLKLLGLVPTTNN
jgi:hypothetical protein